MSKKSDKSGSYNRYSNSHIQSEVQQQNGVKNKSDQIQDKNKKNDIRLNDYFERIKNEAKLETIKIDQKTEKYLCFQINEKSTILYNKEEKTLFKINTVHQNKVNKTYETIIKEMKYEKIWENFQKNDQNQINKNEPTENKNNTTIQEGGEEEGEEEGDKENDESNSSYDQQTDEPEVLGDINIVVCSQDKNQIWLGNSQGRIFVLDAETFEQIISFKSENNKEGINFLSGNKDIIVSASQKFVMLYDIELKTINYDFDIDEGNIERLEVSPYSNLIIIQQKESISVYSYSKEAAQQEGKLEDFVQKLIYQDGQILKFSKECFFIWDTNHLGVFQIQTKKWHTVSNLFENHDKDKIKIKYIETMPDKKNLFVLGQNDQEIKTFQFDSQSLKVQNIGKEQNFFVLFKNNHGRELILLNQNGLILFKTDCKENIDINQLIQEDQELIFFFDEDDKKINFIQICDRSLQTTSSSKYPLIWNKKKQQIVINGQIDGTQPANTQTQTKILNALDYQTQKQCDDSLQNRFSTEKYYQKEDDIAIYAISKNQNSYYGQNKQNDLVQIDTESLQINTLMQDGTRHHVLAVDDGKFLYYKQGKCIYQINLQNNKKEKKLEVTEEHIKDWKLTFDGKFLFAITEKYLYRVNLKDEKSNDYYKFIFNKTKQIYYFEGHNRNNWKGNSFNKNEKDEKIVINDFKKLDISPNDQYFTVTFSKRNDIWLINLYDLKYVHRIEVSFKKNNQFERTIQCFFELQDENNKKDLIQAITIFNIDDKKFQIKPKIEGWDVKNIISWQRLFVIKDQLIEPIIGFNQKLKGLLIDQKIRIWQQIFDEYSSVIPQKEKIYFYDDDFNISGPRNIIFPLILKQFTEQDDHEETQLKLMPYIIKNLVVPFRFSFFSYLAFTSKDQIIKEALKVQDLKLVRDIYGFHPLHYLIIKGNFQQTSNLIQYIIQRQSMIKQLKQKEIADLLRFGPLFLDKLLKKCVKVLDSKECQKQDDDGLQYLEENGIQIKKFDTLKEKLTYKNPDDETKRPAQFKMILVPLDLKTASQSSLELMKAIDDNEILEIYRTDFLKNVIEHKWHGVKLEKTISLLSQLIQLFLVFFQSYHPAWYSLYIALFISGYKYLLVEWLVYIGLGKNQKQNKNESSYNYFQKKMRYNSYISIILGILLVFYSLFNLYAFNQYYSARLLPIITMLSWLCLIRDLETFQIVRDFNLKFIYSMAQCIGFMIFLFLMLGTLTMTRTIMQKVLDKEIAVAKLNYTYNPPVKVLEQQSIYTNTEEDFNQGLDMTFHVIWALVRGDFESDNYGFYGKVVGTLIVFITNVFLLNLLVAIMSDAYNEITTYSNEYLLKRENFITLRLEAIISVIKNIDNFTEAKNLLWIEYVSQDSEEWKSQAYAITERIQKIFNKIFDEKFNQLQQRLEELNNKMVNLTRGQNGPNNQVEVTVFKENKEQSNQIFDNFKNEIHTIKDTQNSIQQKLNESQLIQTETQRLLNAFQADQRLAEQKAQDSQVRKQTQVENSQSEIKQKIQEFEGKTMKEINGLNDNYQNILGQIKNSYQLFENQSTKMKEQISHQKEEILKLKDIQQLIPQKIENSQNQIQENVEASKNQIQSKVENLENELTYLKTQQINFQNEVKEDIKNLKDQMMETLSTILQKLNDKE